MGELFEWLDTDAIKSWLLSHRSNFGPDAVVAMIAHLFVLAKSQLVNSSPLVILPRYLRKDGLKPSKAIHVTSYLDALRGFAALIVVNHHYFPYEPTWFFQLPFIRLFCAGRGMVDVFFVISGYVLSYRMLKLIRTRRATALLDAFASAVFRRYLRLYASASVASFITMILTWLKWGTPSYRVPSGTLTGQTWHWVHDVLRFSNPFVNLDGFWHNNVFRSDYLLVLWTIPIEFRGSLVVFFFCIAACKLSTIARMSLCSLMISMSFYWTATYVALFLGGLLIADVSFSRYPERLGPPQTLPPNEEDGTGPQEKQPPKNPQSTLQRSFYTTMLIIALFLLCQPVTDLAESSFPWPQLDSLIPDQYRKTLIKEHFWLSIGSLMLVFALDSCPMLQTPLMWNFSQYIGEISFGIYVMHLLVLWCFWWKILNPWRISLFGKAMWAYIPFLIPFHMAILWAADLFTRIDNKVVAFGRWLQDTFFEW
jgi:peptidoglycan/LPS O-acetylase OafA/YrhL